MRCTSEAFCVLERCQPIAHLPWCGAVQGGFLDAGIQWWTYSSGLHITRSMVEANPVSAPSSPPTTSSQPAPLSQSHHNRRFRSTSMGDGVNEQRFRSLAPAAAEVRWSMGPSGPLDLQLACQQKLSPPALSLIRWQLVVIKSIATHLKFCLYIHI